VKGVIGGPQATCRDRNAGAHHQCGEYQAQVNPADVALGSSRRLSYRVGQPQIGNQSGLAPELYHATPLLGFLGDQPSEISGRSAEHRFAQICKPRFDRWIGEDGVDFHVELFDDFEQAYSWARQCHTIDSPRSLGRIRSPSEHRQRRGARCRGDSQRSQLASPDVFDCRRHRSEVDLHLAAEQVRQRGPAPR
jgi:hypothetical protein